MALTGKLENNGIELEKAYVRPIYAAINFEGGLTINYETFPTEEQRGKFPNETLQGVEATKEELDAIKAIIYGIAKRTELLENMEDC